MAKPPYHRVLIKERDKYYIAFRLFQQKSDNSLMLKIERSKRLTKGGLGVNFIPFDGICELYYDEMLIPADIEHTSIHASGQSQYKLKDGSYVINYSKENPGIALDNLATVKHLGTLITREMTADDSITDLKGKDIVIERPVGQNSTIIDILAIPSGAYYSFKVLWPMENDRVVHLSVNTTVIPFKGFDVLLFTRNRDQFDKLPVGTLHLPDMNNLVPFVLAIDDKKAVVQLSKLTFDQIAQTKEAHHLDVGYNQLSATSKYL